MLGESAGQTEIMTEMERAFTLIDFPAIEGGGQQLQGEPFLLVIDALTGYLKETGPSPEHARLAVMSYVHAYAPNTWTRETSVAAAGISLARQGFPETTQDYAMSEETISEEVHRVAMLGAAAFGFKRTGELDQVDDIIEYLSISQRHDPEIEALVEALTS